MEIQAAMLLSKLFYSQSRIDEAYKILNTVKIQKTLQEHIARLKQNTTDKQLDLSKLYSLRQLQIYAETHAIRGLCLEAKKPNRVSISGGDDMKKDEQDVIDSFEAASKFAVEHSLLVNQRLQNAQTSSPASSQSSSANTSQTSGVAGTAAGQGVSASATLDALNSQGPNLNVLNNNDDSLDLINPLYEIALQKAPILYIKRGYLFMPHSDTYFYFK